MVQDFYVLQCCTCKTSQVSQVKKSSNKWSCKLCQQKQSIKQVYFQGTGKECRINCQTLNMMRHSKDVEVANSFVGETIVTEMNPLDEDGTILASNKEDKPAAKLFNSHSSVEPPKASKWYHFVNNASHQDDEDVGSSIVIGLRGEKNNSHNKLKRIHHKNKNLSSSIDFLSKKKPKYSDNTNEVKKDENHQISDSTQSKSLHQSKWENFKKKTSQEVLQHRRECVTTDSFVDRRSCEEVKENLQHTSSPSSSSKWSKFMKFDSSNESN